MNLANILLVARRELRQVVLLKSFWLTLLLVPVGLALGPVLADSLEDDEPTRVVVVDRSGGSVAAAIEERFAESEDRALMTELSRYVWRHDLQSAAPDAPWTQHGYVYGPADIAAFRAAGGIEAALAAIARVKPEATPDFDPPPPDYAFAKPSTDLAAAQGADFKAAADALLEAEEDGADVVVEIAAGFPQDPRVGVFTNDQPRTSFVTMLQEVLTTALRTGLLAQQGLSAQAAAAANQAMPAIALTMPRPGGGAQEAMLIRSVVPLALAYILLMALMLSGSWMLQGSVEERSKKLLESVLACITPEELMYGKLMGALGIGLAMLAVWLGAAVAVAFATQGEIADMIRPALEPISGIGPVITLIYFFITGYIAIAILFVGIGALADTMNEAQGYLMPVIFGTMLPVLVLIQAVLSGSSGPLVQIMTWIPLWTPFVVLARLGAGISTPELLGAGVLMAAFVAAEVVLIGRLFRASLLAQGQITGWRQLVERLRPAAD
jgi:ABC-type Na+ efflux pump permease subunit